ncbi:MAG: glycosyltransferase family 4 protein [Candidatus Symbiothrix sp.]|jgi:UDP-N-acetylmuramyl pentapeptide phosphotransferase/UDP-N-acetylglucosamine-1-phosphate transferase|nr:glycosyltransferase family 4 protein [Candidatus Symbiothrix sp.]
MENNLLQYLLVTIILFAGMLLYFKLADKYNIIDKPNERSSHNYITLRGGGIVFWLAGVLYAAFNLPESLYFLIGLTLICGVSFWDDVSSLPNKVRIVIHFLSISLVFYGLGLFVLLPWWLIVIAYIFFVGIMNAYNFMDGINGMIGLYSLVVLIALQYVNYQEAFHCGHPQGMPLRLQSPAINPDFINYAILACIVFLFFNFRKRAKCFAGDIGALGLAFWMVTLLIQLMLATNSVIWILFLAVYGVDTVCTILHRLYLKQNIFQAHRLHFYQILVNERKQSHLTVAAGYAGVQLLICGIVIYAYECGNEIEQWCIGAAIIMVLLLVYLLKFKKTDEK